MRCFICLVLFAVIAGNAQADDRVYLETIKPLLRERCYACHGALKQKAKLRVDTAQSMRKSGVLDEGILLARLTSDDPEERMPPEGEPLKEAEVTAIQTWIAKGSPAPEDETGEDDPSRHWSFQFIERPAVPAGSYQNPIDAFLAQKHISHGLKPQGEAERSLLIRRLYLDLTGLPPTAEQLDATDPIDKIADELLASIAYGERWGRHWMDVWRYSDWDGLGAQLRNSQKHLWHWRDWIVTSLNADKGYDRMIYEMLAGDELAPEDPDVIAGTGFLARNYYLFNRTTWLDDTIEHTAKAFLGLTINCAKCHDHKYDPISQEDYYRFRAIFEPHQIRLDPVPGVTDFEKDGLPRAFDDQPDAQTFLHLRGNPQDPDRTRTIAPGVPVILASFAPAPGQVELPVSAWAPGLRDYVQKDHLAVAEGKLESARRKLEKARSALISREVKTSGIQPPVESGSTLSDDFDRARPGVWQIEGASWRYQGGLLVQLESTRDRQFARTVQPHPSDFDLTLKFRTTGGDVYKSVGVRFDVTGEGSNANTVYASAHAAGPKVQIAQTSSGQTSYPEKGRVNRPIEVNENYELRVQVREQLINVSLNGEFLLAYQLPNRNPGGLIELFAFDATAEFDSIFVVPLAPETVLHETGEPPGKSTADPKADLAIAEAVFFEADLGLKTLRSRIAADNSVFNGKDGGSPELAAGLEKELAVSSAKVALLTAEAGKAAAAEKALTAAEKALKSAVRSIDYTPLRGSFKALETPEHKEPDYPATYSRTSTGRRTALAKWITDRKNPLTARVAVNQIWLRHFGEPIVETVFDFGRRAPRPEHAELLDFLAAELIDSGWSMKHIHRLIVTSQAWQRTSSNLGADPGTFARDPDNKFLWRMNSRRMESQVIRDSILHLAGQLDETVGGPSIDPSPEARRRSLYFKHSRDQQSLLLSTFDDAEILACYRRSESIIPQQALALSNSKIAIEMSEKIPSTIGEDLSDHDFAAAAFRKILGRNPGTAELAECENFLKVASSRARLIHALLNHNDFVMIR